jgi:hypothetical protein
MSNDLYPKTLAPDHEETYELDGVKYTLPATTLVFKQWKGELIKNTFGGKPLIDYEGVPMFAELAIQRISIKAGWMSRWIETYASKGNSPYYFINWLDTPLTQQVVEPLNDIFQEELLAKIAIQNNNSYSGCWDVLVWKGKRTIFLESKRYKKDSVRNTQLRWLRAGREAGLTTDNFLIVQWEFE